MTFNLATILQESATRTPDTTLRHFANSSFSYAQVDEILKTELRGGRVTREATSVATPGQPRRM